MDLQEIQFKTFCEAHIRLKKTNPADVVSDANELRKSFEIEIRDIIFFSATTLGETNIVELKNKLEEILESTLARFIQTNS